MFEPQTWILASLAAALFQAVRYAALKRLNAGLSTYVTAYVRVLFALPFLGLYLAGVMYATGQPLPDVDQRFIIFSTIAAVGQFTGTALVVRLFQLGNFAIATLLIKADVIMTALIGTAFFSEAISPPGWLAILVSVVGVMVISTARTPPVSGSPVALSWGELLIGQSARIGLSSALAYALSYLSLREAILALPVASGPLARSALAAFAMTGLSVLLMGTYLLLTEPRELARIRRYPALATLVGVSSALGTMAWFLASALTNASYVAAVAQVQIVFTLLISRFYFHERIRRTELVGMTILLAGLLAFRLA